MAITLPTALDGIRFDPKKASPGLTAVWMPSKGLWVGGIWNPIKRYTGSTLYTMDKKTYAGHPVPFGYKQYCYSDLTNLELSGSAAGFSVIATYRRLTEEGCLIRRRDPNYRWLFNTDATRPSFRIYCNGGLVDLAPNSTVNAFRSPEGQVETAGFAVSNTITGITDINVGVNGITGTSANIYSSGNPWGTIQADIADLVEVDTDQALSVGLIRMWNRKLDLNELAKETKYPYSCVDLTRSFKVYSNWAKVSGKIEKNVSTTYDTYGSVSTTFSTSWDLTGGNVPVVMQEHTATWGVTGLVSRSIKTSWNTALSGSTGFSGFDKRANGDYTIRVVNPYTIELVRWDDVPKNSVPSRWASTISGSTLPSNFIVRQTPP